MPRRSLGNMLNPVDLDTESPQMDAAEAKPPVASAHTASRADDAQPETAPMQSPTAPAVGESPRRLAAAPTLSDVETRAPDGADAGAGAAINPTQTPKYLTLPRKETRLTDAQLDALTVLSRRINKTRRGAGERITDNTLIRVAVDLLLERSEELSGTTENGLRNSVGLGPL